MKIRKDLSQFENKNALIVVAGLHTADFYIAQNGKINDAGEFKVLYPRFSDKEGFFESAGQGKIFGSGSVLEVDKIEYRHRFLKELDRIIDDMILRKEITDVYIFAPDFVTGEMKKMLPKKDVKQVRYFFEGNYIHEKPFFLLSKIKEKEKLGWKVPVEDQARKILKIPIVVKENKIKKKK